MTEIWNQVVEDGVAFPQKEELSVSEAVGLAAGKKTSWTVLKILAPCST